MQAWRRGSRPAAAVVLHCRRQGSSSSSSSATRSSTAVGADDHRGIFQSQHIKPFPIRAAIDIGTGGVASLCIARVDAAAGAIQRMLHQTQLPLYLEALRTDADAITLSERTIDDVVNKLRVLHGVMGRTTFSGLSERAAVLSWPICGASNAAQLAARLTREFKIDVRVLGKDFTVEWPVPLAAAATTTNNTTSAVAATRGRAARASLKALLRSPPAHSAASSSTSLSPSPGVDARAQCELLAFLAHAAASECVAPQRLVVLHEDPQRGLRLLGTATSADEDVADLLDAAAATPEEVVRLRAIAHDGAPSSSSSTSAAVAAGDAAAATATSARLSLVEHALPVDAAGAHRCCITHVQRRPAASYSLHGSSPNPLLAAEYAALRGLLAEMIGAALPSWVRRKTQLGGVLAGTSFNGGVLNTAARVSQQTYVSLEHLDVHAQHHFCGLTDVLLAETFPHPHLVLPSAALTSAVLHALQSPRIAYLPEVNVAAALLVQPGLWLHRRADSVRARLARNRFFATATPAQRGRAFERPHRKDYPTAAPGATWV